MAVAESSRVIGYARVSTNEQNTAAQILAFERAGVTEVVEERRSAIKDRPELDRLLAELRSGDVLVVYKLDRLARSVSQCVRVFEDLKDRGIGFRSLTESIETVTPHGRMFLHLLSAFAEFERELIRERCHAGQIAARAAGKTWGRVRVLSDEEMHWAASAWRSGWYQQRVLAEMLGISISSLRDYIHRAEGRGRWWKKHGTA
jgi:DNA invertase Pin-like site-specific DNA recombinase